MASINHSLEGRSQNKWHRLYVSVRAPELPLLVEKSPELNEEDEAKNAGKYLVAREERGGEYLGVCLGSSLR